MFLPFLARPATRAEKSFLYIKPVFRGHEPEQEERKRERVRVCEKERVRYNGASCGRKSWANLAYKLIARLYAMYFCEQY